MPRIEILSIGNEVLSGQVLNTNSHFLSQELDANGFTVSRCETIRDDLDEIIETLKTVAGRSQVLISTGGLGPTFDDLTTDAVANCISKELVRDEESWEIIQAKYKERGRPVPPGSEKQAAFPKGARIIQNPFGFAPGFSINIANCECYFLPGVPREMRAMWERTVLPDLLEKFSRKKGQMARASTIIRCFGITESEFDVKFRQFVFPKDAKAGISVHYPEIHLKVLVEDEVKEEAELKLSKLVNDLEAHLGKIVFSIQGESLEKVVIDLLIEDKATISIAESCTGGLIASKLTNVPGSSLVFGRGYITYSNEAKTEDLGVPEPVIQKFGAVSEKCAKAMAEGVRHKGGTKYGLSVTGIAGPSGGTQEKPVGLVYFGLATPSETIVKERHLQGDRQSIRTLSTYVALNLLKEVLIKK